MPASLRDHAVHARTHYELPSYQAFLRRLGELLEHHLRELIAGAGIPAGQFEVHWRIKTPSSFAQKAALPHPEDAARPRYHEPVDEVTDQLALRVVTFLPAQVEAVAQAIGEDDGLTVREVRHKGSEAAAERQFGYQSLHVLVDPGRPLQVPTPPKGYGVPTVEVQLRTQLQHVWAELEHASRYKGAAGSRVSRKFDRAAALIEMVDELLQEIDDAAEASNVPGGPAGPAARAATDAGEQPPQSAGSRLTARALRSLLAELFPDAPPSRGAGSEEWIRRHALAAGVETVEALRAAVRGVDLDAIDRVFREGVTWERNQVRALDDALLVAVGPAYVDIAVGLVPSDDEAQRQKRRRVLEWRQRTLRDGGVR